MTNSPFACYASIILDLSVHKTLDYGVLPEHADKLKPGMQVKVPLRGRERTGYVCAIKETPDFTPVQPIASLTTDEPLVNQELFELALWVAKYYCASLSDVWRVMLPSPSERKRNIKSNSM